MIQVARDHLIVIGPPSSSCRFDFPNLTESDRSPCQHLAMPSDVGHASGSRSVVGEMIGLSPDHTVGLSAASADVVTGHQRH
jgi:hypothetical protein